MLLINPCNIDNCFPLKKIWNVGNWTRGIWVWKKQVCCPPIDFQSLIASFCSHLSKEFELSISWRFSAASFLKVQFKFASSQLFSNLTVFVPVRFLWSKKNPLNTFFKFFHFFIVIRSARVRARHFWCLQNFRVTPSIGILKYLAYFKMSSNTNGTASVVDDVNGPVW